MRNRREHLEALLVPRGQDHVLRFWEELEEAQRVELAREIESIDFELLDRCVRGKQGDDGVGAALQSVDPAAPRGRGSAAEEAAAISRGEELLRAGGVACVTVAGGQASRLGLDGPKGAFAIGPISGSTLFQILAEKILAAQRTYGAALPWWIMTSEGNDAETRAFFARHQHFGLDPADVRFFAQRMIPAVDVQGRLLLASKHQLFRNPNGHGGVLSGLAECGALAEMARRRIDQVLTCQVDNALVDFVDPLFLGRHMALGAEAACKVVTKRDAAEKVGVIGLRDGRYGCIEYSDLPAALREARDAEGRLCFRAGNIAVHAFRRDFLERVGAGDLSLPYHRAKKKLTVLDEAGRPQEREGIKFETFVFDALPRAQRVLVQEVLREEEFAPVKNREGEDSPATAREAILAQGRRWLESSGVAVPVEVEVEISPLWASRASDAQARVQRGFVTPIGRRWHLRA
ncbi:MAG: UTP--glucose-1-phosphate uridylyltransferase [Planctomycetes bacterium]|nr:UTP--glucose-1-phosphate uridylyltransferase [Planctomycetota bacterium]